ncbi:IS66 family insertion sequence element accessory protein TnpB [Paraburkholderia atlantica]|uniref:IS66 family insertion sequence element accessory protein TnpB n=1 Tax=Paraburkholderia atlantica TaxID=2654982 RepID=UPI00349FDF24
MILLRRSGASDQTGRGTRRPALRRSLAVRQATLPSISTHRASRLAVRGRSVAGRRGEPSDSRGAQCGGPACIPGRRRGASGMRSPRFAIGMLNVVRLGDLLKVLWWSGDGMCLLMKRLGKGRFVWPQADGGVICLSPA